MISKIFVSSITAKLKKIIGNIEIMKCHQSYNNKKPLLVPECRGQNSRDVAVSIESLQLQ